MGSFRYAFEGKDLTFTEDTDFTMDGVISMGAPKVPNGGSEICIENSLFPSQEPLLYAKRARVTNLICQVHSCNKELSSLKDYYKRHKVCEIHSKTSLVIVNGLQQRFCQQCSRFHNLGEFDEGKRSCRKRLAGHNERRRKPQMETSFQEIFEGSNSSCALSLLSTQSQNILKNSVFEENCHSKVVSSWFSPTTSVAMDNHRKKRPQATKTVGLIEFSSHLQRIEQQKEYSADIKMENCVYLEK